MGRQRGRHRRRPRASRGRSALGVVTALLAGLLLGGSPGTYAFWSDRADVTGGTFTSGTLDLTVDDRQGRPSAYTKSTLALSRMVPGESVAAALTIRNAGDADLTWVPTATTAGDLAPHLVVTLFRGGTVTGQTSVYPRQQTCSGGTALTAVNQVSPRLAPGGTPQTLCVQLTMPATKGNEVQGLSGLDLRVRLTATQVLS